MSFRSGCRPEAESTKLSSKGQIIIPQAVRESRRWVPGQEFVVIDLANVTLENGPLLAQAFSWRGEGLDFADALHLTAAKVGRCERLATFDQKLLWEAAEYGDLTIFGP